MIKSRLFIPLFTILCVVLLFAAAGGGQPLGAKIELTPEETEWLTAHPVIRHAPDPDYAPFEFREMDGRCVGIAPDYLELIRRKLGVQFQAVPAESWAASLENVKQRGADLVTVAAKTPERSEYMLFTSPYIKMPDVILVRDKVRGDLTMEDLKGKTAAAIKAWAANDYIREKYTDIRLKMVPDVKSALLETSLGSVDAAVLGLATASYNIKKIQITNLRIAGESGYSYELRFASRDDWPQLNRLLEKALANITESDRNVIYNKWISVRSRGWRPSPTFLVIFGAGLASMIIIGGLIWNRRLRREVDARTAALRSELVERNHVQEALAKKSEDLVLLLDGIDTQIWYLTDTRTYGAVNKAHAEFNGVKKEDLEHTDFYEIFPSDAAAVFNQANIEVFETKRRTRTEVPVPHASGEARVIAITKTPKLDEHGEVEYVVCSAEDVTERKRAEEKIKQANRRLTEKNNELIKTLDELRKTQTKLVEAEKMASLGGLVAGVAHEINTPVGVGITAASILAGRSEDIIVSFKNREMKQSDLRKYFETTRKSGELILRNLRRTADLISSFKQVSVDRITEQQRRFTLNDYTRDVIRSLTPRLKEKTIEIDIDCPEDLELNSYPGAFAQILTNLVFNSLIHGFQGETDGKIEIAAEIKKNDLVLKYRDNGKGIPEDVLPRIFDPFFTTDKQRGTGLGMHIIYNIVTQKLNGDIYCESEAGHGVLIKITVPMGGSGEA